MDTARAKRSGMESITVRSFIVGWFTRVDVTGTGIRFYPARLAATTLFSPTSGNEREAFRVQAVGSIPAEEIGPEPYLG